MGLFTSDPHTEVFNGVLEAYPGLKLRGDIDWGFTFGPWNPPTVTPLVMPKQRKK